MTLGRFGWKANQPSLQQQTAAAFNGDMGITTSLFINQNCPAEQTDCVKALKKDSFEISNEDLAKVVTYTKLLSVPERRALLKEDDIRGQKIMTELSCIACHRPSYRTSNQSEIKELRHQLIFPYTDLLVHDMGEDLADNRPDFLATGREWRTPPLWGTGLVKKINRHTRFLHDGRARSVEEAILWHGGEAETSRNKFKALVKKDRELLIQYVESL